jgi:hypothetical protein
MRKAWTSRSPQQVTIKLHSATKINMSNQTIEGDAWYADLPTVLYTGLAQSHGSVGLDDETTYQIKKVMYNTIIANTPRGNRGQAVFDGGYGIFNPAYRARKDLVKNAIPEEERLYCRYGCGNFMRKGDLSPYRNRTGHNCAALGGRPISFNVSTKYVTCDISDPEHLCLYCASGCGKFVHRWFLLVGSKCGVTDGRARRHRCKKQDGRDVVFDKEAQGCFGPYKGFGKALAQLPLREGLWESFPPPPAPRRAEAGCS